MYEQPKTLPAYRRAPIRLQPGSPTPVHNSSARSSTAPASQRDSRLVGHLAALRVATEAVRRAAEDVAQQAELDAALQQIDARISEVSAVSSDRAAAVVRSGPAGVGSRQLHQQAHALAGRLLVVAAALQDTATAMLACRRMDAHAAALAVPAAG